MLSDEKLRSLEAYANRLLESGSFEEAEDKESFLKAHITLVNEFKYAIRNKDYEIFTKPIQEAMEKCKTEIFAYIKQYDPLLEKFQSQIDEIDLKESRIRQHNQNVTSETYDLIQERAKLGFFDGARKKEIDAELAKWQRKEIPPEFDEQREQLKKKIEATKALIYPYQDQVKGINYYVSEAERNTEAPKREQKHQQKTYTKTAEPKKSLRANLQEKQAQVKAEQKPIEAPTSPIEAPELKDLKEVPTPEIKPLKEVHKPEFKPLKRL